MNEYDDECVAFFLQNQGKLFDDPVAENVAEAEAFLEECMAVVVDSLKEVKDYFEEAGTDLTEMSMEELEDAAEVFSLPNGKYLIVEA